MGIVGCFDCKLAPGTDATSCEDSLACAAIILSRFLRSSAASMNINGSTTSGKHILIRIDVLKIQHCATLRTCWIISFGKHRLNTTVDQSLAKLPHRAFVAPHATQSVAHDRAHRHLQQASESTLDNPLNTTCRPTPQPRPDTIRCVLCSSTSNSNGTRCSNTGNSTSFLHCTTCKPSCTTHWPPTHWQPTSSGALTQAQVSWHAHDPSTHPAHRRHPPARALPRYPHRLPHQRPPKMTSSLQQTSPPRRRLSCVHTLKR